MSSPDAVLGIAELGSTALSALLSSPSSLAVAPAVCLRSASHLRSFHRSRATTERYVLLPRLTRTSVASHHLLSLQPSTVPCLASRAIQRQYGRRSFTSSSTPSRPDSSHSSPASASSVPARLPADFDSSSVLGVANPRLFQPPSFISDAGQHLSPEQYRHLSLRLDALHAQLGAQLAVVTVRSVSPSNDSSNGGIRAWAVRLFNQWGIGRQRENDGILVLLVEQQRRIEVVLGDGWKRQSGLSDSVVQRVVNERMVPWLRKAEYGMGLVEGVSALEQLVRLSQQHGQPVAASTTFLTEQAPGKEGGVGSGGSDSGGGGGSGGGTGWGGGGASGRSPVSPRFMTGMLAVVAGFIALRMFTGPSQPFSSSSASQHSRCSRCQGKLKLVGIVDRHNLSANAAFDSSALQSIDRPDTRSTTASSPTSSSAFSFPSDDDSPFTLTERNLYLADYRVDYQHALDSLSTQQADRLRTQPGVQYSVYVCPDCSTLYLQEAEAEETRPLMDARDRPFDRTTPFVGVGRVDGLGGMGAGAGMGGAAAGGRPTEVVWLPSAERRAKGVRRESDMSALSSSGGGGFGGGSSSGGGAGASF